MAFGHPFMKRNNQTLASAFKHELSPIFLQFLDCSHQVCDHGELYHVIELWDIRMYLYPPQLGNAFEIINMAIILLLCYYYCEKSVSLPGRLLSWFLSLYFIVVVRFEHFQWLNLT